MGNFVRKINEFVLGQLTTLLLDSQINYLLGIYTDITFKDARFFQKKCNKK